MSELGIVKDLATYAGPVALAAFGGTFLGGVCLSFFWKNFGPWMLLKEAKEELTKCQVHRDEQAKENSKLTARIADLDARHAVTIEALNKAGLGFTIGPMTLL